MQGPSFLQMRAILMTSESVAQELALRINAAVNALGTQYSELLEAMIFPRPLLGYDRKELTRHKRCLSDDEAYQILLVVWKESRFVTDEVLGRVGFNRNFTTGALTTWSLATKIATSTTELAATNTRIRTIAIAAEAFGLVERENSRATRKPIQGTELLNSFMVSLSENQFRLLADLAPFLSSSISSIDLPKQ
jgi:hypothetical protein